MKYYRAALAAASMGSHAEATRLVQCSIVLQENAANAPRLLELLQNQNKIEPASLSQLKKLTASGQYKKALKIELPKTSKTHTIRGLLLATLRDYPRAKVEFALALALDSGNNLAKQALLHCSKKRGGFFNELVRMFGS